MIKGPEPTTEMRTFHDEDGERWYYCEGPLEFEIDGMKIIVPMKFLNDGYSIPKIFHGIFSKDMKGIFAAVVHDYLYKSDCPYKVSKKNADKWLYTFCRHYKLNWFASQAIYSAVYIGARRSWKARKATFAIVKKGERVNFKGDK